MTEWEENLDPAERIEFVMEFASGVAPVLGVGETISSYSLAVTAEAAALGLTIETGAPYAASLEPNGTDIKLWLSVSAPFQDNAAFTPGIQLGVVATINTSSTPSRRRQRTFLVTVKQL